MNIRRSFAALATAGILVTSSGVGAASADPARSAAATPGSATPSAQFCERAAPNLTVRLRAHIQTLNGRVAKLNAAKTKAQADGRSELANRLQRRIDHLNKHRSRLQGQIARIQQACNLP